MPNTSPRLVASADILPSRFVTLSGDDQGKQSVADEMPIGVAMESTNYPPLADVAPSPALAASAGQYFKLYGDGDECLLSVGADVTAGDQLGPNADGQGIPVSGTTASGAIALESATSGSLCRVQVILNPAAA